MTRKISIYATSGKTDVSYDVSTDVTKWGELKEILEEKGGHTFENMQVVENIRRNTLDSPDAIIPEGDFTLYFRPIKTKSGADYSNSSYSEMKTIIKEDTAIKFYMEGNYNKSYTQLSTQQMREGLAAYDRENAGTVDGPDHCVEDKGEVSEEQVSKDIDNSRIMGVLDRFRLIRPKVEAIIQESTETYGLDDELTARVKDFFDEYNGILNFLEGQYSPEAVAQREEIEKEEAEAAQKEADRLERLSDEANDIFDRF